MISIGDTVKVVHSPYSSVKNGTVATVKGIRFAYFGNRWAVYILDGLPNQAFRIDEIEKEEKNGNQ